MKVFPQVSLANTGHSPEVAVNLSRVKLGPDPAIKGRSAISPRLSAALRIASNTSMKP